MREKVSLNNMREWGGTDYIVKALQTDPKVHTLHIQKGLSDSNDVKNKRQEKYGTNAPVSKP